MTDTPLLIADIGGTNARFALARPEHPFFSRTQTLQCADFECIEDAIDAYLHTQKISQLEAMCFSVAGPIQDESVKFTNNPWYIKNADLRTRYAIQNVSLLNDFSAISYSLSHLSSDDLLAIGGTWSLDPEQDYTVGIVGPGSGLGVGGICRRDDSLISLTCEGGHVGFAAENEQQREILSILQKKFDRVSRERLICGPGLVNLYEALCEINAVENKALNPADITQRGADQSDPICQQALALFFEILGQVSGDIVLSIGAYQGIFIGGGITQRYPQQLIASNFRSGFTNKGRYRDIMEAVPTWLITHRNPGLLGASIYSQSSKPKT